MKQRGAPPTELNNADVKQRGFVIKSPNFAFENWGKHSVL